MANRPKTERNQKILHLWEDGKGLTQQKIADLMDMNINTVGAVIFRHNRKVKKMLEISNVGENK